MVIEMNADTYDWERLHDRGKQYASLIERLHKLSPDVDRMEREQVLSDEEYNDLIDSVQQAIVEELGGNHPLVESTFNNEPCTVFQTPPPTRETEYPFRLSIWVSNTDDNRLPLDAEFTIVPHATTQEDTRHPIVSSGGIRKEDVAHTRNTIDYLFKIKEEAHDVSVETLFSPREAEALLIERDLHVDDREICELMDTTQSNLTTYRDRIEQKEGEARDTIRKAERTIGLISTTE